MAILITGGLGLIGSTLCRRLMSQEDDIVVVDNLWRGKLSNLLADGETWADLGIRFFQYDLQDYEKCLEVTKNVTTVIHLADIVAGINFVFANEYFVYRSNTLINSNVLNAAIANSVSEYLYVGTACSYPQHKQSELGGPPLKEEDAYPADPESSYGWSKLIGEYECLLAEKQGHINVSVLRLHNVYGPPCEMSPEKSQVIPALCRKALMYPSEDFVVWGSGSQRRAFVFVDDAVDAIESALVSGMSRGVIQIGPEKSHSIADIAKRIVSISRKPITIRFDPFQQEGDKDRVADSSKAEKLLGWRPKTTLTEGLTRTYRWAEEHINDA
jgi:GDP-D-mannose 3', 5'-epimerase